MIDDKKEKIKEMRQEGKSYSHIASALGINENTIKAFCRRNNIGIVENIKLKVDKELCMVCKNCGEFLIHEAKRKSKKFCSEQCRRDWWKANDRELDKKAYYALICVECGIKFESYGNKNRKFCGHACYIKNRFNKEEIINES